MNVFNIVIDFSFGSLWTPLTNIDQLRQPLPESYSTLPLPKSSPPYNTTGRYRNTSNCGNVSYPESQMSQCRITTPTLPFHILWPVTSHMVSKTTSLTNVSLLKAPLFTPPKTDIPDMSQSMDKMALTSMFITCMGTSTSTGTEQRLYSSSSAHTHTSLPFHKIIIQTTPYHYNYSPNFCVSYS